MASERQPYGQVGQDESSRDRSNESSGPTSRGESPARGGRGRSRPPRERPRVRFTVGGESLDESNNRATFDVCDRSDSPSRLKPSKPTPGSRTSLAGSRNQSPRSHLRPTVTDASEDIAESPARSPIFKPRPSLMQLPSDSSDLDDITRELSDDGKDVAEEQEKAHSQNRARKRAEKLSRIIGSLSAPESRSSSPPRSPPPSSPPLRTHGFQLNINDIPMESLQKRRKYGIEDTSDNEQEWQDDGSTPARKERASFLPRAGQLVRNFTGRNKEAPSQVRPQETGLRSGQITPVEERDPDAYVPRPEEYRGGILASLLKLYNEQGMPSISRITSSGPGGRAFGHRRSASAGSTFGSTPADSPAPSSSASGAATPEKKRQKWYYKNARPGSTGSIANLVSSSTMLAQPGGSSAAPKIRPTIGPRSRSSDTLSSMFHKKKKAGLEDEIKITVHIAETLSRHKYLLNLCRALMTYGAPTHRLEEYMRMSARVLEIDGQFLYIPGCMLVSFDDATTHTTEVKLVRTAQGVDLGKLRDTHEIYKEVVHDLIGVEEATQRLDEVMKRKQKYSPWFLVVIYGFASVSVGPFAFGARLIDLPIAFILGCLLGILQLIIAPKSELYSNIFEISAAVLTSFLARAFGSIRGGNLFCFSALAQSSIALILPGYTVLCGSLELQSRNIVAGSIRMVYAIIYSLFLGFGITVGTSIYGGLDHSATSEVVCRNSMPSYYNFIFVPPFTLCLIIINQGKWKQTPVMLVIAFAGFVVNHFSALRFVGNAQIADTLGALAIGVLANFYSRLRHGLAAAALLPAIFVLVPSGLAAGGSLVSGVTSANQITYQTRIVNGTLVPSNATGGTTTISNATNGTAASALNSTVFVVGYSMIQVAIGITVGLFLSALVVYPMGKRRSGLFSF